MIEIWEHVTADNPAAADVLLYRIDDVCSRPIDHPRLGPARDDIRPGLRCRIVSDYVALYRLIDDDAEIVRVVHGRRDLFNL